MNYGLDKAGRRLPNLPFPSSPSSSFSFAVVGELGEGVGAKELEFVIGDSGATKNKMVNSEAPKITQP